MKWNNHHQKQVLDLYLKFGVLGPTDSQVEDLSAKLKRDAGSIAFKLGNYRFLDPDAESENKIGFAGISRLDVECWLAYSKKPLAKRAKVLIADKNWIFQDGAIQSIEGKMKILNRNDDNYIKLYKSLLTKPFAILTGASGTGKTKLAETLADYLRNNEDRAKATNVVIVPVGADWTDNRNVLGFVNHLRESDEDDKRPLYQSTPVLDLLLHAAAEERMPHFLILDEMNLSHVERYFADFLSVMEQRDGNLLLHDEGPDGGQENRLPRYPGDKTGVPQNLFYPKNFFVVGTVNIDETTYMFSPKVLDRANVIEFKVGHDEIDVFLNNPQPYDEVEKADAGVAESFLILAGRAQVGDWEKLSDEVRGSIKEHLLALFDIMQRGRFEFAYRTSNEVMRYLRVCRHLAEDGSQWDATGWKSDLDDQILQKILPKLHGSIGRIGALLADLADYCNTGETKEEESKAAAGSRLKVICELKTNDAIFPGSFKKLQSMIGTLLDEQFVSFIQ